MINRVLLKQIIHSNIKFLALFTIVLCVFLSVMSYVFTPSNIEGLGSLTKGTALGNIFGGDGTLITFMAHSFYALMAIIFPMVYSIIVGNRLLAEKVDRGTLCVYLSTPITRVSIGVTSAFYFITSLCVMWFIVSVVGVCVAQLFQSGHLDVEKFLLMNVGCLLYHIAISSICFCASCICNLSKNSLKIGAGLPIAFFVISLFMKLSPDLDYLSYFTMNSLFDTTKILTNDGFISQFLILIGIAIALYTIGILVFQKKDLPL